MSMATPDRLILAVPSKGRLMEETANAFAAAGLTLRKTGNERGYRGEIVELPGVDVAFISASEIAWYLKTGRVHLGVTGEDLVSEQMSDAKTRVATLKKLGFGRADVVVAVPEAWLDVDTMADLDDVAAEFRQRHGRRLRIATKYWRLTQQFFSQKHGIQVYRIVESLGATEGAPAAGSADIVVDITTTGSTLRANHLKILSDGIILKSQACLVTAKIERSAADAALVARIAEKVAATAG